MPGLLPVARDYVDGAVHYTGDVVLCNDSTWQARCDTGKPPSRESSDWVCLARAGLDGEHGRSLRIRGTHKDGNEYQRLDVVAFNGASFVALEDGVKNTPPGPGWQLLAGPGKRGDKGVPGPRGEKGDRGERGDVVTITSWKINRETYVAAPIMSDGTTGPALNLKTMFEQFQLETG